MKPFSRTDRLNDQIKRILSELLERDVKDPRIGFVTITGVEVASDLSIARVYVTAAEGQDTGETLGGLQAAAGFLRGRIGEELSLRNTPELRFLYDESLDRGMRMDALLRRIAEERNDSE
jgi:ribosome-binding factor A